jgi:predicted AlkP superfamily phosphohydrolase/phosphomutase
MTVNDFGREPLWRMLERHGLSVGLYNVPMTHPPAPLNGFMITWPLAPTLGYSYPKSLVHELACAGLHYQSDLVTMYREDTDYFSAACRQIERKTNTILYLLEEHPVDVLITVYTEVDRVSHLKWGKGLEPAAEVRGIYEAMDAALANLLDSLDPSVPVLVVSDHGFGLCRQNFNVNTLLERAGLLRCRDRPPGAQIEAREPLFSDVAQALDAGWFVSTDKARTVDWTRTHAYMPAPGAFGINLNLRGRQRDGTISPADCAAVARDVADAVKAVEVDGQPVFDVVPRERVYRGHRLDEAPDLILFPRRWDIMPSPGLAPDIWSVPTQAGVHREDGIVLARNIEFEQTSAYRVEDIVPTCLAHLGLPIPSDLDGHIRCATGTPSVIERARRQDRSSPAPGAADQARIEQRLAQLGYL